MSGTQIIAFFFSLCGLGAIIAATVSNEWKVTSRASSVITATWIFQGLWMNCAGNAMGAFHCRPHLTIFKIEGYIQACRGLMIAAVCLGFFGSVFALVGMKCTKVGGSDQTKAKIACLAGLVFILCGLSALTGCSLYANRITSEFFDPTFIAQKYELGAALFIGWAGASLCIIGGSIFCFSIAENNKTPRLGYAYNRAGSVVSARTKACNGSDFKTSKVPPKHFDKNAYV
ncbi:claudin-10 isoform X2 [Anolis carolinensis]|uniref:claudin-10 isoform X2 n=1 Tax=Anolis carolinensis TaxID=28377 RepID=UPI000462AD06|nr:PREDICTED: claudin-10 isoform X2 [Anolis carolinensis]|eukprot:XP_008105070.1 PREDICTED: claudin-10 isoform X2 [Anolis carolinensis]